MRKYVKFLTGVVIACCVCLVVLPTFAAEELKPTTLTWIAGGVGGGWYTQAGGMARLINEKELKIAIKVIPGGGVVNPVRVSSGECELGWGVPWVDKMAYNGISPVYKEPYPNIRAIGGIFGVSYLHFVAAKETGIKSVEDLAQMVKSGKAVKIAAPMKGTSDLVLTEFILSFYGISLKDIEGAGGKVFNAVYADMVSLYQDHHVDFVATYLALPAAAITEMSFSRDMTLLPVSEECVDELSKNLGTISRESGKCIIPAGTYKGQNADVLAVAGGNEIIANKDLSDLVVYTITKIICENVEQVHAIHEPLKTFLPEGGWKDVAIPLHPGAEKYYREAGYTK